jgi:uncharacterized membrane protein
MVWGVIMMEMLLITGLLAIMAIVFGVVYLVMDYIIMKPSREMGRRMLQDIERNREFWEEVKKSRDAGDKERTRRMLEYIRDKPYPIPENWREDVG